MEENIPENDSPDFQGEVPEEIRALYDDASGDVALGDLEEAIGKYRRCVEAAPAYFDAWLALGIASMKNGLTAEAVEAGLKAVALRPDDQMAWSSLSLFHGRNNQIPEAEAAGAKARVLGWKDQLKK